MEQRSFFGLSEHLERLSKNGDPLETLDEGEHLCARSDDALKAKLLVEAAVEFEVLPLETHASGGLLDGRPQVGEVERFL